MRSKQVKKSPGKAGVCKEQGFVWWTVGGSNPRPPECDSGALPTELTAQKVTAWVILNLIRYIIIS